MRNQYYLRRTGKATWRLDPKPFLTALLGRWPGASVGQTVWSLRTEVDETGDPWMDGKIAPSRDGCGPFADRHTATDFVIWLRDLIGGGPIELVPEDRATALVVGPSTTKEEVRSYLAQ
jgi:hypothetical protein